MKIQHQSEKFERAGAALLGVSGDSLQNLERMASKKGLTLPLARDEQGQLFEKLGVFRKHSSSRGALPFPSTLLFDGEGILRWKKTTSGLLRRTKPAEILEALAPLTA